MKRFLMYAAVVAVGGLCIPAHCFTISVAQPATTAVPFISTQSTTFMSSMSCSTSGNGTMTIETPWEDANVQHLTCNGMATQAKTLITVTEGTPYTFTIHDYAAVSEETLTVGMTLMGGKHTGSSFTLHPTRTCSTEVEPVVSFQMSVGKDGDTYRISDEPTCGSVTLRASASNDGKLTLTSENGDAMYADVIGGNGEQAPLNEDGVHTFTQGIYVKPLATSKAGEYTATVTMNVE